MRSEHAIGLTIWSGDLDLSPVGRVFLATVSFVVCCGVFTVHSVSAATPGGSVTGNINRPFGRLDCEPESGFRLCIGGQSQGQDRRVPSFDGVPLDADLALPATGNGPFPLIVLLHGFGYTKTSYEAKSPDDGLDDATLASRGYAVLMYTARGSGTPVGPKPAASARLPAPRAGFTLPTSATRFVTPSIWRGSSSTRGSPTPISRWQVSPTALLSPWSWRRCATGCACRTTNWCRS